MTVPPASGFLFDVISRLLLLLLPPPLPLAVLTAVSFSKLKTLTWQLRNYDRAYDVCRARGRGPEVIFRFDNRALK